MSDTDPTEASGGAAGSSEGSDTSSEGPVDSPEAPTESSGGGRGRRHPVAHDEEAAGTPDSGRRLLDPRRAGVAPHPDLGDVRLGHPDRDEHRPVRRHHGAAGPEPGHRQRPGGPGDGRTLLHQDRAEQGGRGSPQKGQADRHPDRRRGEDLRPRPGPQDLREPEVRPALGRPQPAHARGRHLRPRGQTQRHAPEDSAERPDRPQRLADAARADRQGECQGHHDLQPAEGRDQPW